MDHEELKQLEDDLWEAADQLRANSKLTTNEYAMPVLGLIFLRHATRCTVGVCTGEGLPNRGYALAALKAVAKTAPGVHMAERLIFLSPMG